MPGGIPARSRKAKGGESLPVPTELTGSACAEDKRIWRKTVDHRDLNQVVTPTAGQFRMWVHRWGKSAFPGTYLPLTFLFSLIPLVKPSEAVCFSPWQDQQDTPRPPGESSLGGRSHQVPGMRSAGALTSQGQGPAQELQAVCFERGWGGGKHLPKASQTSLPPSPPQVWFLPQIPMS